VIDHETLVWLLPEIALAIVATWTYVGGAFARSGRLWTFFAVCGLVIAGLHLYRQAGDLAPVSGPVTVDDFSYLMRWLAVAAGLVFVLTSAQDESDSTHSETLGSILLIVVGLMLVSSARDLVLLFVGLELISIPTYVLLFLARRGAAGEEAALKYFFLSVLSSAVLLYGFSFLYGAGGSTEFVRIREALAAAYDDGATAVAKWALLLVFLGLAFRLAAVPFHFYAPDVFQGTSSANAGLLAVAPKIAAVAALVRLLAETFPREEILAWQLALVLSLVTMTVGNVLALWQTNVRRMLAYSSIAHAGYMLIGLAAGLAARDPELARHADQFDGLMALVVYLVVYSAATAGAFSVLAYLDGSGREVGSLGDLAGLARLRPALAAALAVFMFSLAGIPPLAGFWGKFALFGGALAVDSELASLAWVRNWFLTLAVVGVLNAAVAAAYYLRIVGTMYFAAPEREPPAALRPAPVLAIVLCTALVLGIGVAPGACFKQARRAMPIRIFVTSASEGRASGDAADASRRSREARASLDRP
jgi:NADH-quinone oxidoreductase subunit N